jgi:diketogulonate reductase-like aldo/keto reductase
VLDARSRHERGGRFDEPDDVHRPGQLDVEAGLDRVAPVLVLAPAGEREHAQIRTRLAADAAVAIGWAKSSSVCSGSAANGSAGMCDPTSRMVGTPGESAYRRDVVGDRSHGRGSNVPVRKGRARMAPALACPAAGFDPVRMSGARRRIVAPIHEGATMRTVEMPGDAPPRTLPVLGLGTWRFGESRATRAAEVASVRKAIELGYRLVDTAEMYGEGGAEEVVGAALAEAMRAGDVRRDEVVVVSKVYPHNASRAGTRAACDRSRRRLGLDSIDVYLLHWRGEHPLAETVDALRALASDGHVGRWGVSNFDVDDMEEVAALGDDCALDQVWYSLGQRQPEFALLPWLRARRMPLMAYSPIDQGRAADDAVLRRIAGARGLTATQVALAAVLAEPGVVAIPKATSEAHLRENLAAADLALSPDELQAIAARFPRPNRPAPLAMN